ncbi:hypothetical protein ACSQ67_008604 [Phaseolus vulgaris]
MLDMTLAHNLLPNIVFHPLGLLLRLVGLLVLGAQCSNIFVRLWRRFILKVGKNIILGWAWKLWIGGAYIRELDVANVRELEDFLINECMYAGIVRRKLDQLCRCVDALRSNLRSGGT